MSNLCDVISSVFVVKNYQKRTLQTGLKHQICLELENFGKLKLKTIISGNPNNGFKSYSNISKTALFFHYTGKHFTEDQDPRLS